VFRFAPGEAGSLWLTEKGVGLVVSIEELYEGWQ
jgi:hypothetical protein